MYGKIIINNFLKRNFYTITELPTIFFKNFNSLTTFVFLNFFFVSEYKMLMRKYGDFREFSYIASQCGLTDAQAFDELIQGGGTKLFETFNGETFEVTWKGDYYTITHTDNIRIQGYNMDIQDVTKQMKPCQWNMIGRDNGISFEDVKTYAKAKFKLFFQKELSEKELEVITETVRNFDICLISKGTSNVILSVARRGGESLDLSLAHATIPKQRTHTKRNTSKSYRHY
jgi:hypothetical protein